MSTRETPIYWLSETHLASVSNHVQAHAQRWAERWGLDWPGPWPVRVLTHPEADALWAHPSATERIAWLRGPDAVDAIVAQWLHASTPSGLLSHAAGQAWREFCLDAQASLPCCCAPSHPQAPGHWGIEVLLPWPDGAARRLLLPLELLRQLGWWATPTLPTLPRWQAADVLAACPVTLPVNLGQISLRLDELQTLERGDVILLDSPARTAWATLPQPELALQGTWGGTRGQAGLKVQRLTKRSE